MHAHEEKNLRWEKTRGDLRKYFDVTRFPLQLLRCIFTYTYSLVSIYRRKTLWYCEFIRHPGCFQLLLASTSTLAIEYVTPNDRRLVYCLSGEHENPWKEKEPRRGCNEKWKWHISRQQHISSACFQRPFTYINHVVDGRVNRWYLTENAM